MVIIAKRTFLFFQQDAPGEVRLVVNPLPGPQQVPEWVRDTTLFGLAVKDGGIQEIEIKSAAPSVGKPEASAPQSAIDPAPAVTAEPAPAVTHVPEQPATTPVVSVPVPESTEKADKKSGK